MERNKTGILLTNIGTPSEPTTTAVKIYLKQFLSDPRVVKLPSLLWQPILRAYILPFRSPKSAKLYQKIWTSEGSPLLVFSKKIAHELQKQFPHTMVRLGMHYGKPSIPEALEELCANQCESIIVLPLFPQYSTTTTESTFDQVSQFPQIQRDFPKLFFIKDYADHPAYINALCESLKHVSKDRYILFSFHGVPKSYINKSDPYQDRCWLTARLVAEQLQLKNWSVAFQSRLGKAKWLMPYTDVVLQQLPLQGIHEISVICPGFAADCLETLEEIAIRGREQFLQAGGKNFEYIAALNDGQQHILTLKKIIEKIIN